MDWNLAEEHFPGAIQIVDLYHARQHLWELARKLRDCCRSQARDELAYNGVFVRPVGIRSADLQSVCEYAAVSEPHLRKEDCELEQRQQSTCDRPHAG